MISVDTETTGLWFTHGSQTFAIGAYDGSKFLSQTSPIDPKTRSRTSNFSAKKWRSLLLSHDAIVMHNASFDLKALCDAGVFTVEEIGQQDFWKRVIDTPILAHLYNSKVKRSLKVLIRNIFEDDYAEDDELTRIVNRCRTYVSHRYQQWLIADNRRRHPSLIPAANNSRWNKMDMWLPAALLKHVPKQELRSYFKEDFPLLSSVLLDYLKADCVNTFELAQHMFHCLMESYGQDTERLLSVNTQVQSAIWKLEHTGVHVHIGEIDNAIDVCTEQSEMLLEECNALCNKYTPHEGTFTDNDIRHLLYNVWELPALKRSQKTNAPSADAKTIVKLRREIEAGSDQHKFIGTLIAYKKYLKKLQALSSYKRNSVNSRLFPSYNVVGTDTTRFSSSNPNGQNIEKASNPFNADDADIEAMLENSPSLRAVFGPDKNKWWVCMDYSQLQLRIFAKVTDEKDMQQAFADGWDGHDYTMHRIFPEVEHHMAEHRRIAKNCFHPDTEILTSEGWKPLKDVQKSDLVAQVIPGEQPNDMEIEFVHPLACIDQQNPYDHLLHFKSEGFDIRVTPDHNMFSWDQLANAKRKGKHEWELKPANQLSSSRIWSNAGVLNHDNGMHVTDNQIRIAAMIQADGSFSAKRIRFGFIKSQKISRFKFLMETEGVEYTETAYINKNSDTVVFLSVSKDDVVKSLSLLTENKTWINTLPVQLTQDQREILLDEVGKWDAALADSRCTQIRYYSAIKSNIDVIQAVAAVSGFKTRISKNGVWALSIKMHSHTKGGGHKPKPYKYTGNVVCVTVPSGIILVRDGGIPIVSGNCNFGFIFGASPKKIEETAGRPGLWDVVTNMFPNAHAFIEKTKEYIRANGHVTTVGGYPLEIPEAWNKYRGGYEKKAHAGVNYIIQGTEGEIVKRAMFYCQQYIDANNLDISIALQVHDEFVFEVPAFCPKKHIRALKMLMEKAADDYAIFAPVDAELVTYSWNNKKHLSL